VSWYSEADQRIPKAMFEMLRRYRSSSMTNGIRFLVPGAERRIPVVGLDIAFPQPPCTTVAYSAQQIKPNSTGLGNSLWNGTTR